MKKKSYLSKIVIGGANFGNYYGFNGKQKKLSKKEVNAILRFGNKKKINIVDTASNYGKSEKIIGEYLKKTKVNTFKIITKFSSKNGGVKEQLEKTNKNLGCYPWGILAHSAQDYLNKRFRYNLFELKKSFKIKKIGVSVYTNEEIVKILKIRKPDIIQIPLSILDKRLFLSGTLKRLKKRNISIHVRSIFLKGLFFRSNKEIEKKFPHSINTIKKLKIIARNKKITLSELSLLWICSLPEVEKVILGLQNFKQLKSHLKTIKIKTSNKFFKDALKINYSNHLVLNPSLWKKNLNIIKASDNS